MVDNPHIHAPHRDARDRRLFEAGECTPVQFDKTAAGANFTMYDDVNATLIPSDAVACAFYGNGHYANYSSVRAQCPNATLAPTMLAWYSGDLKQIPDWQHGVSWDCEPSLFTAAQAGMLISHTRSQGVFPHLYCPLSWASAVCQSIHDAGFQRGDFGLHTAHWTFTPHICGGISTVFGTIGADSTQYTDQALGRSLDASLCLPTYLRGNVGPVSAFPLKQGDSGPQVHQVQRALEARLFVLNADGVYGPITAGKVGEWQHSVKRSVTGQVSQDDWNFMFPPLSIKTGTKRPYATKALQRALHGFGIHTKTDGHFGTGMTHAVKKFQASQGLKVDGVVGQATWAKLFA